MLFFENIIKNKFHKIKENYNVILYVTVFILCLFTFLRIFNINFWGDEGYSIKLAQMPISEMIEETARDVHPPFYYLILRFFYLILGNHGYTYNFVSIIPVIILNIFSITIIKNKYGIRVAFLFSLFNTILGANFTYNIEVRMYSWANLFVFLTFWYGLNLIFDNNSLSNWIIFTVSAILAAYTHYYALIAVFIIMLIVYIVLICINLTNLKKCLISALSCVFAYLPWLGVLIQSFERSRDGWWSKSIPTFKSCITFIFYNNYAKTILIIATIIFLWYLINSIKNIKGRDFKLVNREIVTVIFSFTVFILLVGLGIGISRLIRPLFLERYAFVLSAIIMLSLSLCIGFFLKNKLVVNLLIIAIVIMGIRTSIIQCKKEINENIKVINTVDFVNKVYQSGDHVVTNVVHYDWTIFDCYFDFPHSMYKGFNESYIGTTTWLLYSGQLEESFINEINKHGGTIEKVRSGFMTNDKANFYRIDIK